MTGHTDNLQRVLDRIGIYRAMTPKEGESWESFYQAAFGMLQAEIKEMSEHDDTTGQIISAVYRVIERLGGKSDILSIVGSWRDTLPDHAVLEGIEDWLASIPPHPSSREKTDE